MHKGGDEFLIILDVDEYCHECPNFEATVSKIFPKSKNEHVIVARTYVSCEHKCECDSIRDYLKKEMSHGEKKNGNE